MTSSGVLSGVSGSGHVGRLDDLNNIENVVMVMEAKTSIAANFRFVKI